MIKYFPIIIAAGALCLGQPTHAQAPQFPTRGQPFSIPMAPVQPPPQFYNPPIPNQPIIGMPLGNGWYRHSLPGGGSALTTPLGNGWSVNHDYAWLPALIVVQLTSKSLCQRRGADAWFWFS